MIVANMDVGDMERSELDLLFGAIAVGDRAGVRRRLAASPDLASRAIDTGASRQSESPYYLEPIERHVYAGDTALHIAAAAYKCHIALALIAAGANVRARNRRGAEPLHYAADGGIARMESGRASGDHYRLDPGRCRSECRRQQRCGAAAPCSTHALRRGGEGSSRRWRRCPTQEQEKFDADATSDKEYRSWRQRLA